MKFLILAAFLCFGSASQAANYDWLGKWRVTQTICTGDDSIAGNWIGFRNEKNIRFVLHQKTVWLEFESQNAAFAWDPPTPEDQRAPNFYRRDLSTRKMEILSRQEILMYNDQHTILKMVDGQTASFELTFGSKYDGEPIKRYRCAQVLKRR
jgi:hypothetical protein